MVSLGEAIDLRGVIGEANQEIVLQVRLTTYYEALQAVGGQVVEGADLQATTEIDPQQVAIPVHLKTYPEIFQAIEPQATTEVDIPVAIAELRVTTATGPQRAYIAVDAWPDHGDVIEGVFAWELSPK